MTKSSALCVALLALAACDSGAPDDEVVGSWTFASITIREVVTVTRAQDVLDASLPPEGELTMRGGETGRLWYVNSLSRYGNGLEFYLTSFDPAQTPYPPRRQYLSVSESPGVRSALLYAEGDGTATESYYPATTSETLYGRSGWTFEFDDVPLTTSAYSGQAQATTRVSGRFTFGHRSIPAHTPTTLSETVSQSDPGYRVSYVFRADGTMTIRETQGNRTLEYEASWAREGDEIRLTRPLDVEGVTETLVYRVAVDGSTLVLTNGAAGYPCDAACRESIEYAYGFESGTVRAFASEAEIRFTSGTASAQATVGGAARPIPTAVRARLLLGRVR